MIDFPIGFITSFCGLTQKKKEKEKQTTMTLLGTLVGILGWRSIRNGHPFILHPRLRTHLAIWGGTPSYCLQLISNDCPIATLGNRTGINHTLISSSSYAPYVYAKRPFWTWRGGDDKRWDMKGGSEEEDASEEATGDETTVDAAKETTTMTQQPQLSPSAYQVSVCTAQGFRSYMEDEFFLSLDGDFAAVFDGHGGKAVSRYLRQNLYANLLQALLPANAVPPPTSTASPNTTSNPIESDQFQQPASKRVVASVDDYEKAMYAALDKVDREVQRISHWSFQGSTAVAVWIHEEKCQDLPDGEPSTKRTILAANIGDSRAVLCRNNTAWDLTRDHKPNDPDEQARIESAGGKVVWCGDTDRFGEPILDHGVYRVNGNLALSRAIGDRSERPHVIAEPEIIKAEVGENDSFIVLASDGLWDVLGSDMAVELVLSLLEEGHSRDKMATLVVEEALRRGTYDNITVIIIWLDRRHQTPSQ